MFERTNLDQFSSLDRENEETEQWPLRPHHRHMAVTCGVGGRIAKHGAGFRRRYTTLPHALPIDARLS